MKRKVVFTILAALLPVCLFGQKTIDVTEAGSLPTLISDEEKYTIEELTVTGELNGTDFALLRDMAGNNSKGELTEGKLIKLDLRGASIVAGGEKYLDTYEIALAEGSSFTDSRGMQFETLGNVFPMYSFLGCNSIREIVLPSTVDEVGEYAFYNGLLTHVEMPSGIRKIGERAFYGNNHLLDFTMPTSLTSIGANAFTYCIELTKIELPASLTDIGKNAFSNCKKIREVWSSIVVPFTITDKTFAVYDMATLYVPEGSEILYQQTAAWSKFSKIETFDPATGIASHPIAPVDNDVYSLQGVRLSRLTPLQRGVYIVNGEKIVK